MLSQLFSGVSIHIDTITYTQAAAYWRGEMTRLCSPLISRAQAHIHLGVRLLLTLAGSLPLHTQTTIYWRFGWWWHTHPYPRLIASTNTHSSFTLTGAFPLHARRITRNLRTYFTSVGRLFLVKMVVWQAVLWDIRFLVLYIICLCFLWL